MLNFKIVIKIIGILLMIMALTMLLSTGFSLYFGTDDLIGILQASLFTGIFGLVLWLINRDAEKEIEKREGYLIVGLGWIAVSIFSAMPYVFCGIFPGIHDAFFESVSGLTTTGATVLNDIEIIPRGILFWRSMTQWLGGMGIIVLTIAIFPLLGIGGVELFVAESPGIKATKIHPRIAETAKRLWLIYVGLTVSLCGILYALGMTFYDAINHSLTTISTGGFSTKNESIAHFDNPLIHYVIMLFMLVAGINYTILYFGLKFQFKKVWRSDEFKSYLLLVFTLILILTLSVHHLSNMSFEQCFRNVGFQIVSIITTTGYVTADYTSWAPAITMVFFFLLFTGACAGSTSGGIKVIRHVVLLKNCLLELKRLIHPRALFRVKVDGRIVAGRVLTHVLVFLLIYLMLFCFGTLLMAISLSEFDKPLVSAMGSVATALGNVGPSIGSFGPMDNFLSVPVAGKWILIVLMLLGRLELFTLFILFTPYYWRTN